MQSSQFEPNIIINFIAFQIIWALAVFGAAYDVLWPCYLFTLMFAIWQLLPKNRHSNDLRVVAYSLVIGFILDSAWQMFGMVTYANANSFIPVAPLWIMCLWLAFALTFNHSLRWMKPKPMVIILFGLIGSPISYWAGSRIGAMDYIADMRLVSVVFGVAWAITLYGLFCAARAEPNSANPTHFAS